MMNRDCINFLINFKLMKSKHTLVTFILLFQIKIAVKINIGISFSIHTEVVFNFKVYW